VNHSRANDVDSLDSYRWTASGTSAVVSRPLARHTTLRWEGTSRNEEPYLTLFLRQPEFNVMVKGTAHEFCRKSKEYYSKEWKEREEDPIRH
jgi:hypothetical protein